MEQRSKSPTENSRRKARERVRHFFLLGMGCQMIGSKLVGTPLITGGGGGEEAQSTILNYVF